MVKVCARYCDTTILLGEMEEEKAKEFMKHPYILYNADETEDGEEDCIYPDEMFIDDSEEIPFSEPPQKCDDDWMPF
jgi:hypothetical protein